MTGIQDVCILSRAADAWKSFGKTLLSVHSHPCRVGAANDSPRRGFPFLFGFCQPYQLRAHLTGFFQIRRELLFVMGQLVLGVEARHASLYPGSAPVSRRLNGADLQTITGKAPGRPGAFPVIAKMRKRSRQGRVDPPASFSATFRKSFFPSRTRKTKKTRTAP